MANYGTPDINSCSTLGYGEVEDYPVTIIPYSGTDIKIISIVEPDVYQLGNNNLKIRFYNSGADTIYHFNAGFKIIGSSTYVEDTHVVLSNPLPPGATSQYTISTPLVLSDTASVTLKTWVSNPNQVGADSIPSNDTLITTARSGLSGIYTVGTSGYFNSLTAALYYLKKYGLYNSVVLSLKPGNYSGHYWIADIKGLSGNNTLTIDGHSINQVKFTSLNTSGTTIFTLDGVKNLRIKNIHFEYSYTHSVQSAIIQITGGASNILIDSCKIHEKSGLPQLITGIAATSNLSNIIAGRADNGNQIKIKHCSFENLKNGVVLLGPSSKNFNNSVSECTFNNISDNGVYLEYQVKYKITNCTFDNFSLNSATAINIRNSNGGWIGENFIFPGSTGIHLRSENLQGYYDSTVVINNIIGNFKSTTSQTCIYTWYSYHLRIFHNTLVRNMDSTGTGANLFVNYPNNVKIYNNILANFDKGLLLDVSNIFSNVQGNDFNNNIYYTPAGSATYFAGHSGNYATLPQFRNETYGLEKGHDSESQIENPHFISSTNFHIKPSYLKTKGKQLNIVTDIDGDTRCQIVVTPGADENAYSYPRPVVTLIGDDTVCYESPVTFLAQTGDSIEYKLSWYINGTLKSVNKTFVYTFPRTSQHDTVMLIASNCNNADTIKHIVTVRSPSAKPDVDFLSDKNIINPFEEVKFYSVSTHCPSSWEWRIYPDSIYDSMLGKVPTYSFIYPSHMNSPNPKIRFEYAGEYQVCLKMGNEKGFDSVCKQSFIQVIPNHWMCQYSGLDVRMAKKGKLYDDGGPFSNYSTNNNCHFLLQPCTDTITFTLQDFEVTQGDYLRIYDGRNNQGRPLWNVGRYGIYGIFGSINDTNLQTEYQAYSGSMYFEWQTNQIHQNKGFIGEWVATGSKPPRPVASFIAPDTSCPNSPVSFVNTSQGTDLLYYWTFQPGVTSHARDTVYTYNQTGVYSVQLIVRNCGGTDTFVKSIVITYPQHPATPQVSVSNKNPLQSLESVIIKDSSEGCVSARRWEITPYTYSLVSGSLHDRELEVIFHDTVCYRIKLVTSYGNLKDSVEVSCAVKPIHYCYPVVENLSTLIGMSEVRLNTIFNTTVVGYKAYQDYSANIGTTLMKYKKYGIEIKRGDSGVDIKWTIWIDWNKDGDFYDFGETVLSVDSVSGKTYSDSFVVPSYAEYGLTKMRIGANIAGFPNKPCGPNKFGEFEDYRIKIVPYTQKPVITLKGSDTLFVSQCQNQINDPGATAYSELMGNITSRLVTTHNINFTQPGEYAITYQVSDTLGNISTVDRKVIVIPESTPPIISIVGTLKDTLNIYDSFSTPQLLVYDSCSGLDSFYVESNVNPNAIGVYYYKIVAVDNLGNTNTVTYSVVVGDFMAPTLQLLGPVVDSVEIFNSYQEPGYIVVDNYDKNPSVVVYDSVNSSKMGVYKRYYQAMDSSGNKSPLIERIIKVGDYTPPDISTNYKDGDTLLLDVFKILPDVYNSVSDNSGKLPKVVIKGSFKENFPDLLAKKIGLYSYIVEAVDESGNVARLTLYIHVVDRVKPEIYMLGPSIVNIKQWEVYHDSAYALDNYDNFVPVIKSGSYFDDYLKNFKAGFYDIRYDAVDKSGNKADTKTRYINVEVSSINESDEEISINLQPNPSTGKFYFQVGDAGSGKYKLELFDMLGHICLEKDRLMMGEIYTFELENSGMYLIRISSKKGIQYSRLIISR